jgi:3-isopropylmalate/(R)-2-methylmalate dehydratase small subunit
MKAFTTHTGIPVPLRRANVDTDQIIPAVYLRRITRHGFEDGLFAAWRQDPEFILNLPPFGQGSILITGPDFGVGSSREHAVWALQDFGFHVVIGERFGPIFTNNSGKAGLLLASVPAETVEELWGYAEANPGAEITVNLETREIQAGDKTYPFAIDDDTRSRLLAGLDDIGATLTREADIAAFEATRPAFLPTTK